MTLLRKKSKGVPLTKCPTCRKFGWKLHKDPEDTTSPWYYWHANEKRVSIKVRTCREGKTGYE